MNIWKKLQSNKKPFYVLAPMDDVTDTVFREIVAKHAPADLMMTEFANADGYCSPGKHAIMSRLKYNPIEGPVVAQIWGIDPKNYYTMAKDMKDMGFVGVDINMGCPVKDMIKKGACSAMIQNPTLAAEVIAATKEGAGELPVSVKTRVGFDKIDTENWIGFLLEQKLDALIVHGRTRKEMSKVPAHWEEVAKSVELRDKISPNTVIVGNGDVLSREDGDAKAKQTSVDGIMIGRGIFQNLFVFDAEDKKHTQKEMLSIMAEHIKLYEKTWGEHKSYEPLKKFYKVYINNFDGAARLRAKFMETKNAKEALKLIENASSSVE
jgi:tRNA-dihydrouridine synthase